MVDMDGPPEVIGAAGQFTRAVASASDHVAAVADGLTVVGEGELTSLDRALVTNLMDGKTLLREAAGATGKRAEETLDETVVSATALGDADDAGGAHIGRMPL